MQIKMSTAVKRTCFRDIKFPYEYADRYGNDDIGLANTVLITRNTLVS